MAEVPLTLTEIEGRMAAIRENIRELIEQAAAYIPGPPTMSWFRNGFPNRKPSSKS